MRRRPRSLVTAALTARPGEQPARERLAQKIVDGTGGRRNRDIVTRRIRQAPIGQVTSPFHRQLGEVQFLGGFIVQL